MNKIAMLGSLTLMLLPVTGNAAESSDISAIYVAPRTEWNQPDLQGVWNFSSNSPMLRPAQFGERQYLTEEEFAELNARIAARDAASDAIIPGGGVDESYNDFWVESAGLGGAQLTSHIIYPLNGQLPPLQPDAYVTDYGRQAQRPVRATLGVLFASDGPEDRSLSDRCLIGFNAGPPITPSFYNNNLQIVQNRDHVVIITEMVHDARMVPLDNRPPLPEEIGFWTGDSRGYWEGDTLVVETRNFNGLTTSFSGMGTSEHKHLIERFTRVSLDRIDYEFTLNDPATFTDRIVGLIPIYKVAGLLYEYACHEGNRAMINILRGARVEEQSANSN